VGDRRWSVLCAVLLPVAAVGQVIQKTVDDLTHGRQSPDPEKARRQVAFGARLALWWGFGLGLLMAVSGLAAVVVGLTR
jgi:hypothetical protein